MGPGNHTDYSPHCLRRDFSPSLFSTTGNQSVLDWTLAAEDFWHLTYHIEGWSIAAEGVTTHGAGHLGVGGQIGEVRIVHPLCNVHRWSMSVPKLLIITATSSQMSNIYSSPGDPLFYLHHGGLDWLWWTWQQADWPARNFTVDGPDTQWAYPYNYFGDIPYENITLATPLHFGALADSITVGDVMDTEAGQLCYRYE